MLCNHKNSLTNKVSLVQNFWSYLWITLQHFNLHTNWRKMYAVSLADITDSTIYIAVWTAYFITSIQNFAVPFECVQHPFEFYLVSRKCICLITAFYSISVQQRLQILTRSLKSFYTTLIWSSQKEKINNIK